MICPQCKAEYRPGFTRCADCDVELVYEPPRNSAVGGEAYAGDSRETQTGTEDDPFCSFWKGDDPRIHAEICQLLEDQGIPQKTVRREDHLFNINSRSAFELGIPFSQFEKAEAAIKEAYGSDEEVQQGSRLLPAGTDHLPGARRGLAGLEEGTPFLERMTESLVQRERTDSELPEEPLEPENSARSSTGWDPANWYPEDATAEVWSGKEPELAKFIAAALEGNQIHTRIDLGGDAPRLFVLPGDEARSREIVREIVEGAPPE